MEKMALEGHVVQRLIRHDGRRRLLRQPIDGYMDLRNFSKRLRQLHDLGFRTSEGSISENNRDACIIVKFVVESWCSSGTTLSLNFCLSFDCSKTVSGDQYDTKCMRCCIYASPRQPHYSYPSDIAIVSGGPASNTGIEPNTNTSGKEKNLLRQL
ncbi:hypothetical protein BDR07DRAFT_1420553 [Suillus spraguei]|nr:hypothetical protein BDR07DRAFT_1420553 [Suillus spraguei]